MLTEETTQSFMRYFNLIYANNVELKSQVHKIRYDVFCKELELEKGCPKDVEADEFDDYSYHYLLQHRKTEKNAGTIRMVSPPADRPELLIPLEKYCLHAVDTSIIDITKLPRGSFAEVSRLAVPATFRKRPGESGKAYILPGQQQIHVDSDRRHFPYIAIGLYLTTAAIFVYKKLDYVFVMAEPRLARSMSRVGLHFEQIGDVIDYHGSRAPFFITQQMLQDHLKPDMKLLFEHICTQVTQNLQNEQQPTSKVG